MGNIVQSTSSALPGINQQEYQSISLSALNQHQILPNGTTLVKLKEGHPGILYSLQVSTPLEKQRLTQWAKNNYLHSCNVVQYEMQNKSMFCSQHSYFKAILQYGNQTLTDLLSLSETPISCSSFDRSQTAISDQSGYSSLQILQFIKFLIDTVEEQRKTSKEWIIFHPSKILYFGEEKKFKYLYLPSSCEFQTQTFYDPFSSEQGPSPSEATTIFSLGMVIMSLLLKEDCSDCYNYQNFSFCWCLFEQKKDQLKDLLLQRSSHLLSFSSTRSQVSEDILSITLQTLSREDRVSFEDFKILYYGVLRKLSGFSEHSPLSTKKQRISRNIGKNKILKKQTMEPPLGSWNKQNENQTNLHQSNISSSHKWLKRQFQKKQRQSQKSISFNSWNFSVANQSEDKNILGDLEESSILDF